MFNIEMGCQFLINLLSLPFSSMKLMIACLYETLNSFSIPAVRIELIYITLISSQKDRKNYFVSPSFPGDLLLGIFFRASYSSLSVNSPSHSKQSLPESFGT